MPLPRDLRQALGPLIPLSILELLEAAPDLNQPIPGLPCSQLPFVLVARNATCLPQALKEMLDAGMHLLPRLDRVPSLLEHPLGFLLVSHFACFDACFDRLTPAEREALPRERVAMETGSAGISLLDLACASGNAAAATRLWQEGQVAPHGERSAPGQEGFGGSTLQIACGHLRLPRRDPIMERFVERLLEWPWHPADVRHALKEAVLTQASGLVGQLLALLDEGHPRPASLPMPWPSPIDPLPPD